MASPGFFNRETILAERIPSPMIGTVMGCVAAGVAAAPLAKAFAVTGRGSGGGRTGSGLPRSATAATDVAARSVFVEIDFRIADTMR